MKTFPSLLAIPLLLASALSVLAQGKAPSDPNEALALARKDVKEAVALLKKARTEDGDQRSLSRKALKLLEHAQKLYEVYTSKRGTTPKVEDEIQDLQSLIYWSRKMTPLVEEEEQKAPKAKPKVDPEKDLPGGENQPAPPPPPPPAPKPVPPVDPETAARKLYESAERFERANPTQFFAISARYFEVVDRYRSTSYATRALQKCMEYQRKLLARHKPTAPPPASPPPATPSPDSGAPYIPPKDPTLIRLNLRHPDASIRRLNVQALEKAMGKNAVPVLHDLFRSEDDGSVLDAIAGCLARLKHPYTLKLARSLALERDDDTARKVMRLAARMPKAEYVKVVLIALAVNVRSVHASGRPLRMGFVKPYAGQVASAFASGLRQDAAKAIKAMGKVGETGLKKCLKGRSQVCREAILVIGVLKVHKYSGYVSFYLQRKNRMAFRSEAMAALYLIGVDGVPYLIKNLNNPNLRIWSAYQLREMTGQPWAASAVARWWAWYRQNRK